jgi:ABC-type phosphate/phosphonate transport system substrate-binding protein
MIANARMYSVSPAVATLWRALLSQIFANARLPVTLFEHPEPAPMDELWQRTDKAAVFMCGLPFSLAEPSPLLVAAPVPAHAAFKGEGRYWSDFVVRTDSPYRTMPETFGKRIAFTVPESQSGYAAALCYLTSAAREPPLFDEIVAPTVTPFGALTAVVRGIADVAPIDSYALELLRKYRPDVTAQVRVIGHTAPTAIPPLVASPHGNGIEALQSAFLRAHESLPLKTIMDQLLLQRFTRPDPAGYALLRQRFERALQYWTTHRLADITHPAFAIASRGRAAPEGDLPVE